MKKVRIIARLDVKGPNVVKGIQLEGLRVVGNPFEMAKKYYEQGADELLYMDIVASLYNRNNLYHIIRNCMNCLTQRFSFSISQHFRVYQAGGRLRNGRC